MLVFFVICWFELKFVWVFICSVMLWSLSVFLFVKVGEVGNGLMFDCILDSSVIKGVRGELLMFVKLLSVCKFWLVVMFVGGSWLFFNKFVVVGGVLFVGVVVGYLYKSIFVGGEIVLVVLFCRLVFINWWDDLLFRLMFVGMGLGLVL